ncbi:hypothetical protein CPB84DRAFT_231734 [Gymnopilus junonius]|uniref:Uncharacterized protein n=1 Tax=Gymnopilus junonius TaxID=109634 RepID=A0A9P5TIK2_GYMJU|nr:hypothetical protein CPB84DRAFT_231734 [Gymnopilus junonius]
MAPSKTKRAADEPNDNGERAAKVARTAKSGDSSKNRGKKGPTKPTLSAAEFTARALPLHVNITHTPPSITKEDDNDNDNSSGKDEEKAPEEIIMNVTASDVGSIGNLTLVPTSFSTGSYGWKGSKRITVELQGSESDEEGHKEKVQVILSINATVLGSKPAKAEKGKKGKKAAEEEEVEEDAEQPHDSTAEEET